MKELIFFFFKQATSRNELLIALKVGKSKVKVSAWSASGESSFPVIQHLLAVSLHNERGSEAAIKKK